MKQGMKWALVTAIAVGVFAPGVADAAPKSKKVCVDGKPKVVRQIGKKEATSSWQARKRLCVKTRTVGGAIGPIEGGLGPILPEEQPPSPLDAVGPPDRPAPAEGFTEDVSGGYVYVCEPGYPNCGEYDTARGANFTQFITGSGHRYWEAAADYWLSRQWCPPSRQAIVWVNWGNNHIYGRSPYAGCYYDGLRWAQLNNYYAPRIAGWRPENSWCAVVIHEQGHQLGYYWQMYPWDPYHNYGAGPNSIMYPYINHVPKRCQLL